MDALTRVTCCFPFQSLTCFWIVSNLIINNGSSCDHSTRSLVIVIMAVFGCGVVLSNFTDTYTASNNQKFVVLLVPCYGPVCLSLPTDLDKDRMYEHFNLKIRDYVRAFISLVAFVLIAIFINPISMCLFPSDTASVSRLDPSIVRTVPVVVALVTALVMLCLGPPRQSLGFQNVDETCPPIENQMGNNPIYSESRPGNDQYGMGHGLHSTPPSIPEGEEDDDFPPRNSPMNYNNNNGVPLSPQWSGRGPANSMAYSNGTPGNSQQFASNSQQFGSKQHGPNASPMQGSYNAPAGGQQFTKQMTQPRVNTSHSSQQQSRSVSMRESTRSSQQQHE